VAAKVKMARGQKEFFGRLFGVGDTLDLRTALQSVIAVTNLT
jgi:hypothetical protein